MADKIFGLSKEEFFSEIGKRTASEVTKLEKKIGTELRSMRDALDTHTNLVAAMQGLSLHEKSEKWLGLSSRDGLGRRKESKGMLAKATKRATYRSHAKTKAGGTGECQLAPLPIVELDVDVEPGTDSVGGDVFLKRMCNDDAHLMTAAANAIATSTKPTTRKRGRPTANKPTLNVKQSKLSFLPASGKC